MINVLFIPVSSPMGIGEYMRSLILAGAVKEHYLAANITFVLSEQAPYIEQCPYRVERVPRSPTLCTKQVNEIINKIRPDVVVFDAAGRAAQYKAAKAIGAKVIFISQHKKKRARAFALNRIGNIDAHCITQFQFIDGCFTPWQKLKLRLFDKPSPIFIGPVFDANISEAEPLPGIPDQYVLFSAGSGGHTFVDENGVERLAADILLNAAKAWYQQTNEQSIVVLGPNYPSTFHSVEGIHIVKSLPNNQLMHILKGARCAVLGGGSVLSQAVVLGTPSIAIAITKDQPPRIKALVNKGLIETTTLRSSEIIKALALGAPPSSFSQGNGCDKFLQLLDSWFQRELNSDKALSSKGLPFKQKS